jgi:hypothetical protein
MSGAFLQGHTSLSMNLSTHVCPMLSWRIRGAVYIPTYNFMTYSETIWLWMCFVFVKSSTWNVKGALCVMGLRSECSCFRDMWRRSGHGNFFPFHQRSCPRFFACCLLELLCFVSLQIAEVFVNSAANKKRISCCRSFFSHVIVKCIGVAHGGVLSGLGGRVSL